MFQFSLNLINKRILVDHKSPGSIRGVSTTLKVRIIFLTFRVRENSLTFGLRAVQGDEGPKVLFSDFGKPRFWPFWTRNALIWSEIDLFWA